MLVVVRGAVVDGDKVLLAQNKRFDKRQPFWHTIGGRLKNNETIHQGLKREFIEEVGVEPQIGPLFHVGQFNFIDSDGNSTMNIIMNFLITNPSDFKKADLKTASHAHELLRVGWVPFNTKEEVLPEDLLTNLKNFNPDKPEVFFSEQIAEDYVKK